MTVPLGQEPGCKQSIDTARLDNYGKPSQQGRRSAGLSMDLLWKRKVYGHQERGHATWEDNRDVLCHCREKIHVAKA